MAQKAQIVKALKEPKFPVRRHNRCLQCGRARAVWRKYNLCRIHIREHIYNGLLPGVKKASW